MRKIILLVFLLSFFNAEAAVDCSDKGKAFFAVIDKNENYLNSYINQNCSLEITDDRGYTLYDKAALKGHQNIMNLLSKHSPDFKNNFSSELIRLLQIGLRSIDIDAGPLNGKMNNDLASAIKKYQAQIHMPVTGKITSDWLPIFEKRLIKETQSNLNALGFKAGVVDGYIGKNTSIALQAFRKEKNIVKPQYRYIDDQLIYQMMMAVNEKHKVDLQKEKEAAKVAALKAKQDAIRKQQAAAKKKAALEEAKRAAAIKKKKIAETARKAEKVTVQSAKEASAQKSAISNAPAGSVALKTAPSRVNNIPGTDAQVFKKISGTLVYHNSRNVCSIGGQKLDESWCSNYYTTGKNKQCDAVVSKTGVVVSLICK